MSTLKSSAEDLTLNADGSGNDIILQSNASTKAIITAEGNVGIGVTPESWNSGYKALQIGGIGTLYANASATPGRDLYLVNNVYHTTGGAEAYIISSDEATLYKQQNGTHEFKVAPSGTADAAISWTTPLTIDNNGTVTIDQDTNNIALKIDSEATGNYAVETYGKYGLYIAQDISGGRAGKFTRNLAEAGSYPLVEIRDDHTSNTQPSLKIIQDGAGIGLQIDQDGNNRAIYIDSESTSHWSIEAYGKYGVYSEQDISGGKSAFFTRNIAEAGSYPLVEIRDNHTSNTQPALKIQQDGAGYGIQIDQNGNRNAIFIDSESTTNTALQIEVDALTTGKAAYFYSNSATTDTRNLVEIKNDHASATGTTALKVTQDSTGAAAVFEGNVGIGVTPESGWGANSVALQIGDNVDDQGALAWNTISGADRFDLMYQCYFDGTDFKRGSAAAVTQYEQFNGTHAFQVAASDTADSVISWTTAMSIANDGKTLFETKSGALATDAMKINNNSSNSWALNLNSANGSDTILITAQSGTGSVIHHQLNNSNGKVGEITTSGSATTYTTSSDYRLKENVVPMTGSIDRLKELKPSKFNFIADADKTVDGFLAHEAQEVVPEAITGTKDAMQTEEYEVEPAVLDDDGEVATEAVMGEREVIDPQGIDQSKLVPLLVGALQEAIARIETLENA
jgi:hypothetical protein